MMKTAIQNGKIITYTDTISVQENHSLIIEKDIILKNCFTVKFKIKKLIF